MKNVARLVFFTILMIAVINIFIEIVILNVTKAKVIATSSMILEQSAELANYHLEDGEKDVVLTSSSKSSTYSEGLIDSYRKTCEEYYSASGQNISFTRRANPVYSGNGHMYDYVLEYNHVGSLTDDTVIKTLEIYLETVDMATGEVMLNTVLFMECYYHSDFLKHTLGENSLSGDIVYYDSLIYDTVTGY